ncbi:MAG: hypothetical protein M5R36_09205 [Deltaproteobacteria bacterium]|nr:hypothetical protein [Deltaproteobacteria bacterium]
MNAKPTSAALAVEQIATALAALGLALAASSFFVPSMAGVVAPFRETYFFLMEFLFWGLVTNAAMLGVSAALIAPRRRRGDFPREVDYSR